MSKTNPETVKAVAMTAPGKMEMRSYPYPQTGRDSAILKVEMTGVCGTDKHIFKGEASLDTRQVDLPLHRRTRGHRHDRRDRRERRADDGFRPPAA